MISGGMQSANDPLASTLSADQATESDWDAIVIGAGLAGSIAAIGLAKSRRRVLLVERSELPRSKVCGACLNLDAVSSLQVAGAWQRIASLGGHELKRYELRCKGKSVTLPLPGGHAVSRFAMDRALAETAIEAGAEFLSKTRLKIERSTETHVELSCAKMRTYRARVVVDASGLNSNSHHHDVSTRCPDVVVEKDSRIGLGAYWTPESLSADVHRGTIHIAVSDRGYVGLVVTEGGRINLAAAVDRVAVQELGPAEACKQMLDRCDLSVDDGYLKSKFFGTTTLTRHRRVSGGHRLLFAGDSSGYVEPFTGEGMAWALRAGLGVVSFVNRGIDCWDDDLPEDWTAELKRLIGPQKRRCRIIARTLRHSSLVRASVSALSTFPSIGQLAVDYVQQARPISLSNHWPWNCGASS
ncbi:MAG: NAD(P)/FAD-dependent oxidoreductase [Planctomycetota bacterium]